MNSSALLLAMWSAFTMLSREPGGHCGRMPMTLGRAKREAIDLRSIFQIKLSNDTKIQLHAGPTDSEFAMCLTDMADDEKTNVVLASDLNGCGKQSLRLFEHLVRHQLEISSLSELPSVIGNLSRVDHMSSRIVKHIDNVEKQMKRTRMIDHMEGTLFEKTLRDAQDAFRVVGETASLRSLNLVTNIQHFVKDFNRSMTNFNELANSIRGLKKSAKGDDDGAKDGRTGDDTSRNGLQDLEVITKRLQKDIYTLHNLTAALPSLQNSRRLTEQTAGNFTLMMRRLTLAIPEVVRRMGPLRDRRGALQIRDLMDAVSDNMRNASLSLTQQPLQRTGRSDIFSAVDGFQSAIGHMGAAFHDLLRGTLAFINPGSWQPIVPLMARPLTRPLLTRPLLDRRMSAATAGGGGASDFEQRLPLIRPLRRPPMGLLALHRVMELGLGRRQPQFDPFTPLDINPRRQSREDSHTRSLESEEDDDLKERRRRTKDRGKRTHDSP